MKKLALLLIVLAPFAFAQGKKKVVIAGVPETVAAELRKVRPDIEIVPVLIPRTSQPFERLTRVVPRTPEARQEVLRALADADGYIGVPTPEMIKAAKKLKWIQAPGAGVEEFRFPELTDSNIILTNFQKIASPGLADHALGMLLALTRQLNEFIADRPQGTWGQERMHLLELQDMTAVVIGVGGIGSNVATRAWACGMKVIGVDPRDNPPSPFIVKSVYPDRLDSVLPEADVVFVCAPSTPESKLMMGKKQFDLMKKGSFFIASSRGALYDMDALIDGLKSGKLAGAGVDVTTPEPLPKGHPLWQFSNVIITPHIGTMSQHDYGRQIEVIKENLVRFAKGEPLQYVVDKQKGY